MLALERVLRAILLRSTITLTEIMVLLSARLSTPFEVTQVLDNRPVVQLVTGLVFRLANTPYAHLWHFLTLCFLRLAVLIAPKP